MKKRQHLPLMAKLDIKIDIDRLLKEFYEFEYDDWSKYNGLDYDKSQEDGLIVRRVLLEYFLTEEEKKEREGSLIAEGGEAYKMLCLTEYNGDTAKDSKNLAEKIKSNDIDPRNFARKLEKISDPSHPEYVPIADEKRYDKRNEYCKGYIQEIMDTLEEKVGHVSRSRFAVLKSGEKIKPHIDINTDKAVRIHIPLITHPDCVFGVRGKNTTVEQHMPADGSVWFINQGYTHYVNNDSPVDRVHLVFVVSGQNGIEESLEKWQDESNPA
jgi:hypothetical protein